MSLSQPVIFKSQIAIFQTILWTIFLFKDTSSNAAEIHDKKQDFPFRKGYVGL